VCLSGPDDDVEDSDESAMDVVPSSTLIAKNLGVGAPHIQLQKASFFAADDEDNDNFVGYVKHKGNLWPVSTAVNDEEYDCH